MSLLPFQDAERLDPFGHLSTRRPRLAQAIAATTKRRDTRQRRAQILLMLLQHRCSLRGNANRPWYVPGAVARLGADWLETTWRTFWHEAAPSIRTIREHLRRMQDAGVLVAAPGDWLPMLRQPDHPERRPRYPDTLHILDTDADAAWWAEVGIPRLKANPRARYNPTLWRQLFRTWRADAAALAKMPTIAFAEDQPRAARRATIPAEVQAEAEAAATVLERAVARFEESSEGRLELLTALAEAGARVHGAIAFQMHAGRGDLAGSTAMLAQALRRRKPIGNRAGWLVAAWRDSSTDERREARADACRSVYQAERVAT